MVRQIRLFNYDFSKRSFLLVTYGMAMAKKRDLSEKKTSGHANVERKFCDTPTAETLRLG
jgi:hypothetical protein